VPDDGGVGLLLDGAADSRVQPGDLLALRLSDGSERFFRVRALRAEGRRAGSSERTLVAAGEALVDPSPVDLPLDSPPSLQRIERLRFDLVLWDARVRRPPIAELGFNASHPRFWGEVALIESSPLYRQPSAGAAGGQTEAARLYRGLRSEQLPDTADDATLREERRAVIPLAGRLGTVDDGARSTYLPLGMPAIFTEDQLTGPDEDGDDDVAAYDERTFLDPYLLPQPRLERGAGRGLIEEAFHRLWVSRYRLRGLHALIFVDEAALLAVPDAVHPAWTTTSVLPEMFRIPFLEPPRPQEDGGLALEWTSVAAGPAERPRYQLEEGEDPAFAEAAFVYEGEAREITRPPLQPCPPARFYRVRAAWRGDWGPWSNTRRAVRGPLTFERCDETRLEAPELQRTPLTDGWQELAWHPTGSAYTVEAATDPAFATGAVVFDGAEWVTRVRPPQTQTVFYRVRARRDGEVSAWSNTVVVTGGPRDVLELSPAFDDAVLLAVHRAAFHVCAARKDAVAILSLPRHFEKRDAIGWLEAFRHRLGLPSRRRESLDDLSDIADLSYAAVYHPWLLIRDETSPDGLRATPPDGAACGMIAARERARGVWVAPANLPLAGVLGLVPALSRDDWAELFDQQFNLIRAEPRDFRAMSAHTLSDDRALLQLSVRRLMILLRKMAAERGMDYVFEPNDGRFRESVRLALDGMLTSMFARGAFAGATPGQSFRVVTDATVNPAPSVDQGRFIALVQVAPSQPLEFLTVLLTRVGEDLLQATEA
jgi:tail sheath protein